MEGGVLTGEKIKFKIKENLEVEHFKNSHSIVKRRHSGFSGKKISFCARKFKLFLCQIENLHQRLVKNQFSSHVANSGSVVSCFALLCFRYASFLLDFS